MRRVGLLLDPAFENHDTGPGHPERPERLRAIRRRFDTGGIAARCVPLSTDPVDDGLLRRVHDPAHVDRVDAASASGARLIDSMDTAISRESAPLARLAAGSLVAACAEVHEGRLDGAFLASRPPGHHAEYDLAMGFCLYNSIAIAAMAALERGVQRVAIVDFDVHHGNGTERSFYRDPRVLFISTHQYPFYPGTGAAADTGEGDGHGFTVNVPLERGSTDGDYMLVCDRVMVPVLDEFSPDLVLVSAGFDAHERDPLAHMRMSASGFALLTAGRDPEAEPTRIPLTPLAGHW